MKAPGAVHWYALLLQWGKHKNAITTSHFNYRPLSHNGEMVFQHKRARIIRCTAFDLLYRAMVHMERSLLHLRGETPQRDSNR